MIHRVFVTKIGNTKVVVDKPHMFSDCWDVSFYNPKWHLGTYISCPRNLLLKKIHVLLKQEVNQSKVKPFRLQWTR